MQEENFDGPSEAVNTCKKERRIKYHKAYEEPKRKRLEWLDEKLKESSRDG